MKDLISRNRFELIMSHLRFDDKDHRRRIVETDKSIHVRAIWERFVANCAAWYKPGKYLTVDEQLFPSKSRCPFMQYMPYKPDKFGLKFWILCDSKYVLGASPYLGKDNAKSFDDLLGEHVVKTLIQPYKDK